MALLEQTIYVLLGFSFIVYLEYCGINHRICKWIGAVFKSKKKLNAEYAKPRFISMEDAIVYIGKIQNKQKKILEEMEQQYKAMNIPAIPHELQFLLTQFVQAKKLDLYADIVRNGYKTQCEVKVPFAELDQCNGFYDKHSWSNNFNNFKNKDTDTTYRYMRLLRTEFKKILKV